MNRRGTSRPTWIALAAAPLLLAAIVTLQTRIDARTRSVEQQKAEILLRSGPLAKKLSLGYNSLLADIYWTRVVQLYGERVGKTHEGFDLLWPLLDITTTLDPKLIVAYSVGAIFLSQSGIGGAGRPDLAAQLIKRGIAANPEEWHLQFDLGFLYYWYLKDYPDASAAYLAAAKTPGAPQWLGLTAARMAEKGGSVETSRIVWSQVYESTKDPNVRKTALEELNGLKAQDDELHLDQLAEDYRHRFGRYPASTHEMKDAGVLRGIPLDPAGFPYIFGPDGKSRLDPQSPVKQEPAAPRGAPAISPKK